MAVGGLPAPETSGSKYPTRAAPRRGNGEGSGSHFWQHWVGKDVCAIAVAYEVTLRGKMTV